MTSYTTKQKPCLGSGQTADFASSLQISKASNLLIMTIDINNYTPDVSPIIIRKSLFNCASFFAVFVFPASGCISCQRSLIKTCTRDTRFVGTPFDHRRLKRFRWLDYVNINRTHEAQKHKQNEPKVSDRREKVQHGAHPTILGLYSQLRDAWETAYTHQLRQSMPSA